jgi:hypothetical protein
MSAELGEMSLYGTSMEIIEVGRNVGILTARIIEEPSLS